MELYFSIKIVNLDTWCKTHSIGKSAYTKLLALGDSTTTQGTFILEDEKLKIWCAENNLTVKGYQSLVDEGDYKTSNPGGSGIKLKKKGN